MSIAITKTVRILRAKKRQYVHTYLLTHPCVDCQEPGPIVLEFDHVRGEKKNTIGYLMASGSMSKLLVEMEKCDVRCANCHRRKTARDFGWDKTPLTDNEIEMIAEDIDYDLVYS